MIRRIAPALVLAGLVAVVLVVARPSHQGEHRLTVITASAQFVTVGVPVRGPGGNVGEVTAAHPTRDGRAQLTLRIDNRAWPLSAAARMRLTFGGGSIKYSDRWIELTDPKQGPPLAAGQPFPSSHFTDPVEFDTLFGTFDAKTRANLRSTLLASGRAVGNAGKPLHAALGVAPPAVHQVNSIVSDAVADDRSLSTLLSTADGVVGDVNSARPNLARLIQGASTTFTAIQSRSTELRDLLAQTPSTLAVTRSTLHRADSTLDLAASTLSDLRSGVGQLRSIAAPLSTTLGTVRQVAPKATATLATVDRSGPAISTFVSRLTTISPLLESAGHQAADQLACIRPYAPDIAGFLGTWSGFTGRSDGIDKYARVGLNTYPFPTDTPLSTEQLKKVYPQITYAFPEPPGYAVGKPWFLPECGVGPDSLDPAKDPEAASAVAAGRDKAGSKP